MFTPPTEPVRLFIAVDLSPTVRALVKQTQAGLQQSRLPVRWADPDGAHITLKYLGLVQSAQLEEIVSQLHALALQHQPFTLCTGMLGAFPDMARPRVLWLAVDGDRAALQRLRDAVEQRIAPLGFPTEARPFAPHLTLGRTRNDITPQQRTVLGRAIAQQPQPRGVAFAITEVVLFRSDLGPTGAQYTPLVRARLGQLPDS